MENPKDESLLELIPKLSAKQKAFRPDKRKDTIPLYKLLREPTHFQEIDWKKHRSIAIWRENHTLICVGPSARRQNGDRRVCFTITMHGTSTLECAIYGKKDSAVADTVVFFWSLYHVGETRLEIYTYGKRNKKQEFSFHALSVEQLARIMDANPTRQWVVQTGTWSADHSLIFATRPYPLYLKLSESLGSDSGFRFKDGGTAFVDALTTRQASFGSLCLDFDMGEMPLNRVDIFRLFELEIFDKLSCSVLDDELVLHPFSAQVNALDYEIHASHIRLEDVASLNIVTRDLNLRLYLDHNSGWNVARMLLILNRVATMGHFERFGFSIDCTRHFSLDRELGRVAEELVDVIKDNTNLTYLNLGDSHARFDGAPYLQIIFRTIEEHTSLCTIVMSDRNWDDSHYSLLEQLLSRKRDVIVLDPSGKKISNGSAIDNAYLLNQIYHNSTNLLKESAHWRPLLVETALVRSTSKKFPHMALLLSNHADILCESLLLAGHQEGVSQPPSEAVPPPASRVSRRNLVCKRKRMIVEPSSDAVTKAARNGT